ncbi:MAG: tagaturonate reductase, partial [Hyphomonadaceae bacterium]|nr:tagaturonate reductase [Clostridia bacterium]
MIKDMQNINEVLKKQNSAMPEKVLQFGEGNFLRAFADWMIDTLNQKGAFLGKVVVVQPIQFGMVELLNKQEGQYTLIARGTQNAQTVEERQVVTAISRGINPYVDCDAFMACADNADMRVVISNTTESGIAYDPNDKLSDRPQSSFPGKVTALLYRRFQTFKGDMSKGFIFIPCELIDRNGDNLKAIVLRLANEWALGSEFIAWLENANYFANTLVDRIVTGYPKDEIEALQKQLGYVDQALVTSEIFHLWVIELDQKVQH